MKKLGFIGFGNMGKAIAFPIKEKFTIYIFDPFVKKSENYIFLDSLEALFEAVDTILLCVKPAQVPSVLHQLSRPMNIISIAAGVSIQSIRENSPEGSKIIRVMPNLAVQVAEGASAYYGEESLYPLVEEIFSSSGISLSLTSESLMDAVTGLSGSGPAFVFSFIHSLAEGGVKCGLTYP
ncbi:MAG: NAD(P)-binding domain-containing protein, partial [Leptospiraceae bacterium]|nr:NAD(P)-binding domain-containing protein [Leptospiraceae bacterium]